MKLLVQPCVFAAALSVAIAGTATAPVSAETMTSLDARAVQTNVRPAIPFTPLPMLDPKTGQPCSADTLITLPNGQQTTAGQYYAEMNRLEQQFNAIGYSLRGGGEVKLLENKADQPLLEGQAAQIAAVHKTAGHAAIQSASRDEITPGPKQASADDAPRLQRLDGVKVGGAHIQAAPFMGRRNWDLSGGNSLVRAYLRGWCQVYGRSDVTQIQAHGVAGGQLSGATYDLLAVDGLLRSYKSGSQKAQVKVWVTGLGTVYNLDREQQGSWWNPHDSIDKGVNVGASFHFMAGPVPMVGRIGARGSVGLGYSVGIGRAYLDSSIWPRANCEAYASVAASIVVAEAGVRGRLTLLDNRLKLDGKLVVDTDRQGPFLNCDYSCHNDMRMLNGNLEAYVEVGVWPFKKSFTWDIFHWSGFNANAYIWAQTWRGVRL